MTLAEQLDFVADQLRVLARRADLVAAKVETSFASGARVTDGGTFVRREKNGTHTVTVRINGGAHDTGPLAGCGREFEVEKLPEY